MTSSGDLFSRNWGFISDELQETLARTCLFVAGTGLGSVAAVQAARTGFGRFILADGDSVERSNLNRQIFETGHIGRNKAEVVGEIIARINPAAEIEVVREFLGRNDFDAPLEKCDFALNTIDWENHAFIHLNQRARRFGRTVLFPLNIGWGGALYILPPDVSPEGEPNCWLLETIESPTTIKRKLILYAVGPKIPGYLLELMQPFMGDNGESWPYDPQLGAGTAFLSALIVRAAVALAAGEKVRHVPEVVYVDFAELLAGPSQ